MFGFLDIQLLKLTKPSVFFPTRRQRSSVKKSLKASVQEESFSNDRSPTRAWATVDNIRNNPKDNRRILSFWWCIMIIWLGVAQLEDLEVDLLGFQDEKDKDLLVCTGKFLTKVKRWRCQKDVWAPRTKLFYFIYDVDTWYDRMREKKKYLGVCVMNERSNEWNLLIQ